jgi:hypothetical protein
MEMFGRMMEFWQVPSEDSCRLLALPPGISTVDVNPTQLGEEEMFRISYFLGIYKALRILFGNGLADNWVKLPNTNVMFGGQTPLAYMITGGLGALRNVRKLLDARYAGNT